MRSKPVQRLLKRIIDITGSAIGLLLLSPVMAVTAYSIAKTMGTPVIYSAPRTGKGGELFRQYKFRTMIDAKDAKGNLLPDAKRLTPLGKRIRSMSIDELPQLINVLKGDMSLVGPRPLLLDYLPLYSTEQRKRFDVPQGVTGWAQINGRNAISWQEKFAYDVWYVENWSLLLDIKIILLTMLKVFKREGISAKGAATMPKFMGNN